MARYIDADKEIEKYNRDIILLIKAYGDKDNYAKYKTRQTRNVIEALQNAPTADVVEVVHGEWIDEVGSFSTQSCSNCNWRVPYFNSLDVMDAVGRLYNSLHYCPNCGAKMDGKKVE